MATLIEQLRNGDACISFVKGRDKVSDLRKVIKYAFPDDGHVPRGTGSYYKAYYKNKSWIGDEAPKGDIYRLFKFVEELNKLKYIEPKPIMLFDSSF